MAETKNEQQPHSFKRKLGNTTYTVKVHFSKDTDKTFKDRVQKLIINECLEKIKNNPLNAGVIFVGNMIYPLLYLING